MARQDHTFINALKQAQVTHAVDSLKTPRSLESAEYGRVSGFLQGLFYAEELYLQQLKDEDKRE